MSSHITEREKRKEFSETENFKWISNEKRYSSINESLRSSCDSPKSSIKTKESFPNVEAKNLSEKLSNDLKNMKIKGQSTFIATKAAIMPGQVLKEAR